ncbi:hypothetical protein F0919_17795 [Taibaiella lutea]|uniref:Uncharacterized protein n=1 Tax=Taibaiella lutea TaxID=2608001 RepID=A0A5M6CGU1_9BACT|nr:hypothetical protein [Taibaiella lutea]KAA5532635.1 hypothetical protein F0919_17795 [Taibaiella lutea]
MEYLGLIITLLLLTIGILLFVSIRDDRKRAKQTHANARIDEAKYYEVKYRMQYITAVFPLIIAVVALIGRKELSSISDSISSTIHGKLDPELKNAQDSINVLRDSQDLMATRFIDIQTKYQQLDGKYNDLINKDKNTSTIVENTGSSADNLSRKVNQLAEVINSISDKDIVKSGVYVIRNVPFNKKQGGDMVKYYFKDIKRSNGEGLPTFPNPPIVYIETVNYDEYKLMEVTNEYFTVWMFQSGESGMGTTFNMVIIE